MTSNQKKIIDKIVQSQGLSIKALGLRFDRVAMGVHKKLETFAAHLIPKGKIVVLTLTAPVRLAAKTELRLEEKILKILSSKLKHRSQKMTIHKNKVSIQVIDSPSKQTPRIICFVHNPSTRAKVLLSLVACFYSS